MRTPRKFVVERYHAGREGALVVRCTRFVCTLLAGTGSLTVFGGCSAFRPDLWYLHNANNQKEMEKVQENWAAFEDENAGLWPTLIRNQKRIADASLLAQQMIDEVSVKTGHLALLGKTWKTVRDEADDAGTALDKQLDDFRGDLEAKPPASIKAELEELKKAGKKIEAQLAAAVAKRQAWEAKLYLLERGTQEFLAREARKRQGEAGRRLKKIFADIENEEIVVFGENHHPEPPKSIGTLLAGDEDIAFVRELTGLLEPAEPKKFLAALGNLFSAKGLKPPPGIDYEILALGADLARIKLGRMRLVEEYLHEMKAVELGHEKASQWLKDVRDWVDQHGLGEEKVLSSLKTRIGASRPGPAAQDVLEFLQYFVLADDYHRRNQNLLDVRLSSLRHEYNLRNSALNAQEHEALIDRGLQGLAVYHAGGIKAEELATIYRAAQLGALFWIASEQDSQNNTGGE